MLYDLFKKFDKLMKSGDFFKVANKYLATLLLLPTIAYADVSIKHIDHTTVMTKDSMVILDKTNSIFWKADLDCVLPIDSDSNVKFSTVGRKIKKDSEITFIIETDKPFKKRCSVKTIAAL